MKADMFQITLALAAAALSLMGFVFPDAVGWATVPATGSCVIAALKSRSAAPRRSRYVGGWFCHACGADNPDEDSPCADKTSCDACGAARPPLWNGKT